MKNLRDDKGFNQVWADTNSTQIRSKRRSDYMISRMQPGERGSILEIGCGVGKNAFYLAEKTGMRVLATDICEPFILEARTNLPHANLRFEILDFNRVEQFRGEQFDYVVGNGILHHLYHHLDEAFANIYRLLKKNGKLIFLEPNIYNPYVAVIFNYARNWAHLEPTEMAFSKSFVTRKLSDTGFKNIEVEYKDFLLPGIPDFLIQPSILVGNVLEKTPVLKMLSQSIYISAQV